MLELGSDIGYNNEVHFVNCPVKRRLSFIYEEQTHLKQNRANVLV